MQNESQTGRGDNPDDSSSEGEGDIESGPDEVVSWAGCRPQQRDVGSSGEGNVAPALPLAETTALHALEAPADGADADSERTRRGRSKGRGVEVVASVASTPTVTSLVKDEAGDGIESGESEAPALRATMVRRVGNKGGNDSRPGHAEHEDQHAETGSAENATAKIAERGGPKGLGNGNRPGDDDGEGTKPQDKAVADKTEASEDKPATTGESLYSDQMRVGQSEPGTPDGRCKAIVGWPEMHWMTAWRKRVMAQRTRVHVVLTVSSKGRSL